MPTTIPVSPHPPLEITIAEPSTAAVACPSCGEALAGDFCHGCGEGRPGEAPTVRRFLREAAAEFTSVDSKTLRTLRALVTRPGLLTEEHLRGRRKPYVGPLKMYLIVFAVVMFLTTVVSGGPGFRERGMAGQLNGMLERVAGAQGVAPAQAQAVLLRTVFQHMSWLSLLIPLFFGLLVHAAFRRRRRWFAENLVFAVHFSTLYYLLAALVLPLEAWLLKVTPVMIVLSVATTLLLGWYLFVAVRRVYGLPRGRAVAASLGLMCGFWLAATATSLLALGTSLVSLLYL